VADHTKWGVVGLSTIVGLSQADVLITDPGLSPEVHEMLSSLVGELIVASPGAPETVSAARAGVRAP
jgi:DeoR/GlpR family transcriptional regulator of sugar metabolism